MNIYKGYCFLLVVSVLALCAVIIPKVDRMAYSNGYNDGFYIGFESGFYSGSMLSESMYLKGYGEASTGNTSSYVSLQYVCHLSEMRGEYGYSQLWSKFIPTGNGYVDLVAEQRKLINNTDCPDPVIRVVRYRQNYADGEI